MALSSLRLRRTLCAISNLHRSLSATSALSFSHSSSSPMLNGPTSAQSPASHPKSWTLLLHSRTFRSSSLSSARSAPYDNNQNEKMDPNTVLFEGCDYNHWLIVMDYPQTNRPPAEEMVRTYEETCAKGLNIRSHSFPGPSLSLSLYPSLCLCVCVCVCAYVYDVCFFCGNLFGG